jgi:hypothetical protein
MPFPSQWLLSITQRRLHPMMCGMSLDLAQSSLLYYHWLQFFRTFEAWEAVSVQVMSLEAVSLEAV